MHHSPFDPFEAQDERLRMANSGVALRSTQSTQSTQSTRPTRSTSRIEYLHIKSRESISRIAWGTDRGWRKLRSACYEYIRPGRFVVGGDVRNRLQAYTTNPRFGRAVARSLYLVVVSPPYQALDLSAVFDPFVGSGGFSVAGGYGIREIWRRNQSCTGYRLHTMLLDAEVPRLQGLRSG